LDQAGAVNGPRMPFRYVRLNISPFGVITPQKHFKNIDTLPKSCHGCWKLQMPPRRQNRERTIRRKILFYRVNVGADTSGKLKHFDPGVLAPLGSLSFDEQSGRYFIEPDGNALCLWIDSQAPRLQLRFGRIRRTDLPLIEQHGKLTELRIDDDAGLSEPIHLIFFDNNIVGGEFNFYGPRLSRLSVYLADHLSRHYDQIKFEPLIRPDVFAQLNRLRDIRLFDLKLRAAYVELVRQADPDLGSAFDAANRLGQTEAIAITIRPEKRSRESFLRRILPVARRLAESEEIASAATHFVITGIDNDTGKVEPIDILQAQLLQHRVVAKISDRGRAVNSESVYNEICNAYASLRGEIDRASSVSV
jgi:hypothetical protein